MLWNMFPDLAYSHIERKSHEEGNGVAYVAVWTRRNDAMNSSFDCTFSGSFKSVAEVDYKTVRDRAGTCPFA